MHYKTTNVILGGRRWKTASLVFLPLSPFSLFPSFLSPPLLYKGASANQYSMCSGPLELPRVICIQATQPFISNLQWISRSLSDRDQQNNTRNAFHVLEDLREKGGGLMMMDAWKNTGFYSNKLFMNAIATKAIGHITRKGNIKQKWLLKKESGNIIFLVSGTLGILRGDRTGVLHFWKIRQNMKQTTQTVRKKKC